MAIEPKTVMVDGHKYEIHPLPAEKALDVLEQLGRLFGPAALKGFASVDHLPKSGKDLEVLAPAAMMLATSAPPGTLMPLVKDLLSSTYALGAGENKGLVSGIFAVHFQGRTLSALKLAVESVKVNYADFFAALGGLPRHKAADSKASTT